MPGAINWSVDATANDVSDPPVLFQEGQPAPTVNNAARALMASVALWRDDNIGALRAFGAGDYTVLTGQGVTARTAKRAHTLAFYVTIANQGPCTLGLDSNTLKPWLRSDGSPFGPGDVTPKTIWQVSYLPELDAYITRAPSTPAAGQIILLGGPNPPPGYVLCDGSAVSRTAYAALFAAIGTAWGAGDGGSTFNLPDLRGRAPFGWNGGTSRLTGAGGIQGNLGASGGLEAVTLTPAQLASHVHTGQIAAAGGHNHTIDVQGAHAHGGVTGGAGSHQHNGVTSAAGGHAHSGSTDVAGAHAHTVQYAKISVNQNTPLLASVTADIFPTGNINAGGATDPNGNHQHQITTNPVGDHTHPFATSSVGDHVHAIQQDGAHTHALGAVADHTHGLTVNAAGSGDPHANMPPGAVVMFAIKT